MIIKAEKIKIIPIKIADLDFRTVLYGERSQAGAMGNAGGIILYVLDGDEFIMYYTNLSDDEVAYREGLFKIAANEDLFDIYAGGMGNGVFIRKGVKLEIIEDDQAFWYEDGGKQYKIESSVRGVFETVAKALQTGSQGMIDPMQKSWEQQWRDEFKKSE